MKKLMVIVVLLSAHFAFAADLQVTIPNLHRDRHGRLGLEWIWLCNNRACFDHDGGDGHDYLNRQRQDLPIKQVVRSTAPIHFTFRDLPAGEYSLSIHHDRDSDGRIDTDSCFFGTKPRDGFGFSNNVDPSRLWRKPHWSEVKFRIGGANRRLVIRNIYLCD